MLSLYLGSNPVNIGRTLDTSSAIWQRPTDWLPMPNTSSMTGSVGSFVGLYAVHSGSANFLALTATNAFFIDWGDGSPITSSLANVQVQKQYDYETISASTYSSGSGNGVTGYRQVFVTLTPSGSGVSFTGINLQKKHTQASLPSVYSTNWLDIAYGGTNVTTITIGGNSGVTGINFGMLENINLVSMNSNISLGNFAFTCAAVQQVYIPNITNSSTSCTNMFNGCTNLRIVSPFYTGACTTHTSMFFGCNSLPIIPSYNLSSSTSTGNMFIACYKLQSVPFFNTSNVTSAGSMFQNCYSLQYVPLYNFAKATATTLMFNGCVTLQTVPQFNFSSSISLNSMFNGCNSLISTPAFVSCSNVTNTVSMFQSCTNLKTVGLFDCSNVTNASSMFQGCSDLTNLPQFNFGNCTTFTSIFQSCATLRSIPVINTANGTNFNSMFNSCTSLQSIPLINTAKGTTFTSMFNACSMLKTVPPLNMFTASGSGALATIFSSCPNLSSAPLSGSKSTISYAGCLFGRNELVSIFNNLAPTGSVACTITTTTNWGSSSLSPADILIASSKGWTVTA